MLAPFRQKKGKSTLNFIIIEREPFLIIDECRYDTKLVLNVNADLVQI